MLRKSNIQLGIIDFSLISGDVVEYLSLIGVKFSGFPSINAQNIMKWYYEKGSRCDDNIVLKACKIKNPDVIKFLYRTIAKSTDVV